MTMLFPGMERGWAVFNEDRSRRWELGRRFEPGSAAPRLQATWIGFNPSVADGDRDDPTIRREVVFTRRLLPKANTYVKVNLCDYVCTNPKELPDGEFRLSAGGRVALENAIKDGRYIVAAWGALGKWDNVRPLVERVERHCDRQGKVMMCLGRTSDGSPRHPLYLAGDTPIEAFYVPPGIAP